MKVDAAPVDAPTDSLVAPEPNIRLKTSNFPQFMQVAHIDIFVFN